MTTRPSRPPSRRCSPRTARPTGGWRSTDCPPRTRAPWATRTMTDLRRGRSTRPAPTRPWRRMVTSLVATNRTALQITVDSDLSEANAADPGPLHPQQQPRAPCRRALRQPPHRHPPHDLPAHRPCLHGKRCPAWWPPMARPFPPPTSCSSARPTWAPSPVNLIDDSGFDEPRSTTRLLQHVLEGGGHQRRKFQRSRTGGAAGLGGRPLRRHLLQLRRAVMRTQPPTPSA
jgi:hypothetical protein